MTMTIRESRENRRLNLGSLRVLPLRLVVVLVVVLVLVGSQALQSGERPSRRPGRPLDQREPLHSRQ